MFCLGINLIPFFPNRPFLGPFLLQGLFSFMHVAWNDIFSLSDHFPLARICISPLIVQGQEQMLIFSSSLSINNSISSNTTIFKVNAPINVMPAGGGGGGGGGRA